MKKQGSVLATVLIIATVLLMLGTAVSAAVINTTKINRKYSENVDLELAAKSALNIIKEDFISKVNNKDIKTLNNVETYKDKINNFSKEFSENFNVDLDFENIKSFFEEYLKDGILLQAELSIDEGNRLKIKSIAENKDNKIIKKEESQIIVLNFNDSNVEDEGKDSIIIKPANFINIKGNLEVKDSSQKVEELSNYISLGGKFNFKGQNVNKDQSEDMKELNLLISNSFLDNEIDEDIYVDTEIDEEVIEEDSFKVEGPEYIINKQIIEIENTNIKINSNVDISSDKTIKIKNGVLKINGNLNIYTQNTLKIDLENSKLIINGKIYSADKIIINSKDNSAIYVNNNLEGVKEVNININNSKIVSKNGSLVSSGNFTINAEQNSIIYANYRLFSENGMDISLNSSKVIAKNGELVSNSEFTVNANQNSIIYTNTRLYASKLININSNNSKIIVENGELVSNGEFNLIINNNSEFIIGKKLNGSNKVTINSSDSDIILGIKQTDLSQESLRSAGSIVINSLNSSYIINSTIVAGNGLIAELNNSALICNGKINLYEGNSKITNIDKSFLMASGNTDKEYIYGLELKSMSDNFTPDNKNVIATINKYISLK